MGAVLIDYVKRGRLLQYAETLSNTSGGLDVNQNSRGALMIADQSKQGMRKVAAQEIGSIDGLRKLYSNVISSA